MGSHQELESDAPQLLHSFRASQLQESCRQLLKATTQVLDHNAVVAPEREAAVQVHDARCTAQKCGRVQETQHLTLLHARGAVDGNLMESTYDREIQGGMNPSSCKLKPEVYIPRRLHCAHAPS